MEKRISENELKFQKAISSQLNQLYVHVHSNRTLCCFFPFVPLKTRVRKEQFMQIFWQGRKLRSGVHDRRGYNYQARSLFLPQVEIEPHLLQ